MTYHEKEKKVRYTSYLPESSADRLRELSEQTRVPQARLLEEAIADLLHKYYGKLPNYQKKM